MQRWRGALPEVPATGRRWWWDILGDHHRDRQRASRMRNPLIAAADGNGQRADGDDLFARRGICWHCKFPGEEVTADLTLTEIDGDRRQGMSVHRFGDGRLEEDLLGGSRNMRPFALVDQVDDQRQGVAG